MDPQPSDESTIGQSLYIIPLDSDSQNQAEQFGLHSENTDLFLMNSKHFKDILENLVVQDKPVYLSHWGNEIDEDGREYGYSVRFTTAETPQIIYESGAFPCSIICVFDEEGNSGIVHLTYFDSFINNENNDQPSQKNMEALEDLQRFAQDHLKKGKRVLITSTNVDTRTRKRIVDSVKTQMSFFDESEFFSLFSDGDSTVLDPANLKAGELTTTISTINSLYFIPANMSIDGKNKIVMISDDNLDPEYYSWRISDIHKVYPERKIDNT